MPWYASPAGTLQKAATSPGSGWELVKGAADTDTLAQATQQYVDDVAAGDYGSSPANLGGAVETTLGISNPFTSVEDALTKIWAKLSDYKMWRSLGWLALGVLLMIAGVALLIRKQLPPALAGLP